ncbi:hypothetical protein [Paraburkholderia adhaesiva]|uniref:hypothetical protein n=1 Tax=Paraburkholderia adhaesiva TaxID=2883244 RepID=UPI001F226907|nr:hypothetical protein [Paraburkholderia adhaesiva]
MSDINDEPLPGSDAFKRVRNGLTGDINPDAIQYTEPQTGIVWSFVPRGHRFFDLYERWLAAGNTPLPADAPPR